MTNAPYLLGRQLAELRLANDADEPKARIVHLKRAHRYSERAIADLFSNLRSTPL